MKATVRISAGLTPDALLEHHPPPPPPPAPSSLWRREGLVSPGASVQLEQAHKLFWIFPERVMGTCAQPWGGSLPKGDLAHQPLWLPYKHPGETLNRAQECVCSRLPRIKICKIYFSRWTNSPSSALMKQLLPRTPSRQNCTITS